MSGYFARLAAQAAPRTARSSSARSPHSSSFMAMAAPREAASLQVSTARDNASDQTSRMSPGVVPSSALDVSSNARGTLRSRSSDASFPMDTQRGPHAARALAVDEDIARSATHTATRSVASSIDAFAGTSPEPSTNGLTAASRDASTAASTARDARPGIVEPGRMPGMAAEPVDRRGGRDDVDMAHAPQVPTTTASSTSFETPAPAIAAASTRSDESSAAASQDVIEAAEAFSVQPQPQVRAEGRATESEAWEDGRAGAGTSAETRRAVAARNEAAIDTLTTGAASRMTGGAAAPRIRIGQIALEVHVAPPPSRPAAPPVPQPGPIPAAAPAPPRFSARRHYLRWG
ncbi:MAG TPA: hypothetical protein VIN75_03665 [Burkholderiaceae bacterium]